MDVDREKRRSSAGSPQKTRRCWMLSQQQRGFSCGHVGGTAVCPDRDMDTGSGGKGSTKQKNAVRESTTCIPIHSCKSCIGYVIPVCPEGQPPRASPSPCPSPYLSAGYRAGCPHELALFTSRGFVYSAPSTTASDIIVDDTGISCGHRALSEIPFGLSTRKTAH